MTPVLFAAFLLATAGMLTLLARRFLPARDWSVLVGGLALWFLYVGGLSWFGLVRDPTLRPPGVAYIVGPAVVFVLLVVLRSRAAGRIARTVPLSLLIGFQIYRIGVELFLHQLWREGLVPRMLTFEGANVDIWIGVSAPLAAWLSARGPNGERLALVWNVLGLVALANVVVRSALTAPGSLHLLDAEVANRAIGTFPYTFIAGFFAPLAVTLHVLALRAIAARLANPAGPKGLPA